MLKIVNYFRTTPAHAKCTFLFIIIQTIHLDFVSAAALLRAQQYNIRLDDDNNSAGFLAQIISESQAEKFKTRNGNVYIPKI